MSIVWFSWLMLVVGLVVILVGCDVFTNSIEWLGKKLDLNEGMLGSIFAAVGTALPETLIPIVAVVFGASTGSEENAHDVGLGAIIGAPFMLATVAMIVTGIAVLIFSRQGRRTPVMKVNSTILSRDIRFFLLAFVIALASGFIAERWVKVVIAIALVAYYIFYVYKHATDPGEQETSDEDVEELSPLHFARRNDDPGLPVIILQIVAGLAMIIGAATLFVQYVTDVAHSLGVTTLILSLIIVPLATELPEKFNSVLWVRRSKDTLALGNITGAMVFQSTLPVAFGMSFTEWRINAEYAPAFAQAALAIIAASILFLFMRGQGRLSATALIVSGVWYVVWVVLVFPLELEKMVRNLGFGV
ncbi:MAG TPA: sodium:calcium antiporter [Chloroflexia bacterium]|nr:sodium:calcium antiporter [Chloroflexia bacterium]